MHNDINILKKPTHHSRSTKNISGTVNNTMLSNALVKRCSNCVSAAHLQQSVANTLTGYPSSRNLAALLAVTRRRELGAFQVGVSAITRHMEARDSTHAKQRLNIQLNSTTN